MLVPLTSRPVTRPVSNLQMLLVCHRQHNPRSHLSVHAGLRIKDANERLAFQIVELLQSKGCQQMEQNNKSNQDSRCCTNEGMPKFVGRCHVLIQSHPHASLRHQRHITNVAQLAANQAPNGVG